MITFQDIPMNASLNRLRAVYLDSLPQPQEMYVESQIRTGHAALILRADKTIGYLILSQANTLMEFHVTESHVPRCEEVFGEIIRQFHLTRACCKSYDALLLKCGLAYTRRTLVVGTLFRDQVPRPLVQPEPEMFTRVAGKKDLPEIHRHRGELFEAEGEIEEMVSKQSLLVFSQVESTVGWGWFNRVIPERPDMDVGMLVHPHHRQRGLGTYIIQYLREFCLQSQWRPICGCAKQNLSSRRTLERAGFLSRYDLLEFEFEPELQAL